ncbi:hypothetical protein [Caulobacter sp. 17J65-9]|uniref:hypothetical protein n=1 Tax=Caulobacter sp. 17J65-9 TaxID=2709382 RepID=UPI0013C5A1D1|nr:hypothetical protein [Caulobacter sp. 17J65-9]NEX92392.1 hypothetical protein [Caulobacter sp. 17J65-9]
MGAFNELIVDENGHELAIQFKAGERRQHCYRLGQAILPGFDDLSGTVLATGMAGWGTEQEPWRYFVLTLEDGVLRSYREVDEATFDELDRSLPERA